VALKPIYDAVGIRRINVATYQAVSGAGAAAIRELAGQTAAMLSGASYAAKAFPQQIAFNAIPQIGEVLDNGYSSEEMKMLWETQKILNDPQLQVNPTCVRVPVFYGHSEAVALELGAPLTAAAACKLLKAAPGVKLLDNKYPTAVAQAAGNDPVYVGRVRSDLANDRGLNLWIVSDNLRKGAALNSIQIAEYLLKIGALR
jgi:aspartate-semialdehyde dehydrogenase